MILSVIYAAFSAWLFARGVKANGFLLLGFALVFLLIALFSKKFQLFIVLRLMKKRNKALAGKTVEYAIDGDGVEITSSLGTGKIIGRHSTAAASRTDISTSCASTTMLCS